MDRIVILGVSGAVKTTLAKKMRSFLQIEVHHLDREFWQNGWKEKDKETRIDILKSLVQGGQWIIDGNYLRSSELHLSEADTIIFLDMPPFLCLRRLIQRHFEYPKRSGSDIPEGCKDRLTLLRMVKVPTFPLNGRRTIEQKLRIYSSKSIYRLYSPKEVEAFLRRLETDIYDIYDKRDSSNTEEGRDLVTSSK